LGVRRGVLVAMEGDISNFEKLIKLAKECGFKTLRFFADRAARTFSIRYADGCEQRHCCRSRRELAGLVGQHQRATAEAS
jgi:hypothetical protein